MRTSVCVVLLAVGCGDDGGVSPDAGPLIDTNQGTPVGQAVVLVLNDSGSVQTLVAAGVGQDYSIPASMRDDGPCHIERKTMVAGGLVNAGTVTFSGGANTNIVLQPMANNGYGELLPTQYYAADDMITVSGTGATAPAFSSMIVFPPTLTVTAPTSLSSVRRTGLSVTWTATTAPVVIMFLQYSSSEPDVAIRCVYDGAAGSANVPGSALADLVAGVTVAVSIRTEHEVSSMVGPYPFTFQAIYAGFLKSGLPVQP